MTAPLAGSAAAAPEETSRRAGRATTAIILVLAGMVAVTWFASVRNGLLYIVGAGLGMTLVLGDIGFTGAWRGFIVARRARGLVATFALLAFASAVFIPILAAVDGTAGNLAPAGLSVLVGAFVFGIGMQLGNGCGSGTLVGAGGGSPHAAIVLVAFLPGSLLGSLHVPWWLDGPLAGTVVDLGEHAGVLTATVVHVALFLTLAAGAVVVARRAGNDEAWMPSRRQLAGCLVLVALALIALLVSGRMWSVTFGHALWGAKVADLAGLPVADTVFWSYPFPANALAESVFADVTSVMNMGLLAGVAALAVVTDRGARVSITRRQACAALAAGLLMGYGARLAFGCNIGALLSGSASGSLHAWLWLAAAWAGCHLGIRLRPRCGLANQ